MGVSKVQVIKARMRRMRSQYKLIDLLRESVIIPKTVYDKLYMCVDHLDQLWILRLMVKELYLKGDTA